MAHSLVDDEIQSCIESAEPITIMLPRHQTPGRRKLNMKKKIMSMVIAAAAMALSLVGCGVDINSIGLPPNVVMEKGETQQLEIEYGTDDKAEQERLPRLPRSSPSSGPPPMKRSSRSMPPVSSPQSVQVRLMSRLPQRM